jgi:hypothetical protein
MQAEPRTTAARARHLVMVLALAAAAFGGIGFHGAENPAGQGVEVLGRQIKGSGPQSSSNGPQPSGNANGATKKDFLIEGSVAGLYPTIQTTLDLTITNPNNFAVKITSLTVTVGDASVDCASTYVNVVNFAGTPDLIVPKNGTAPKSLPLTMSADAPDECQGAVFPMTYAGTAVKP